MPDKTLPEQIADKLRRDILRGKLPPGTTIKERENAAEMGVSRTPLREAVRILATEGLVELRPARSPIVAVLGLKQVIDDVEVLLAIEMMSSELACTRATADEIDKIDAILQDLAQHFETRDALDTFEQDMAFHAALARASHNTPMAEIHATFLARLWRVRYLAAKQRRNRERVVTQHTAIVQALRDRDPAAIRRALAAHLDNLAEDISAVIGREQAAPSLSDRKDDDEALALRAEGP